MSFQTQCHSVMLSTSTQELSKHIIDFARERGFSTVGATVITEHSATLTEFQSVHNAPSAYRECFLDLSVARRDPVCQHCKHSPQPIIWNQKTYVSSGAGELWEHQAMFGYRVGIALAFHLPRRQHFLFTIDGDGTLPRKAQSVNHLVEDTYFFAAHAQAAAFELSSRSTPIPMERQALSPRELDALRWTMAGKTSWEIGNLMNMSERAVTLCLQRAILKLGTATKYEASLKAIRLGLLTCD